MSLILIIAGLAIMTTADPHVSGDKVSAGEAIPALIALLAGIIIFMYGIIGLWPTPPACLTKEGFL